MMELLGIVVGPGGVAQKSLRPEPSVRLDLFQDFFCPFCKRFENANGATLQQLVDAGHAQLMVHPIAFLDRYSKGTEFSSRAAAAAYAVARLASSKFAAFSQALYAAQPPEGTPGLDNAAITDLALGVGVLPVVAAALAEDEFMKMALKSTRDAIDLGVQGTPTLILSRPGVGEMLWDSQTPIPVLVRQLAEA